MFKINNLNANADKLHNYLRDRIEEINASIKDHKDRTIESLSLKRD